MQDKHATTAAVAIAAMVIGEQKLGAQAYEDKRTKSDQEHKL